MPSVLLAATTTILLSGLITHVKDPSSDARTAFLVAGPGHLARIEVANFATFVDEPSSTWTGTKVSTSLVYNLSGQKVVINHGNATGTVNAPAGGDFDVHVPHLKKIVNTTTPALHNNVVNGDLHNSTASIRYTKGDLGVFRCYADDGDVEFPAPATQGRMCIARWVQLTFTTTANWEIQDTTNGRKIVVKPGATVRIFNVAPSSTVSTNHYLMHANLLASGSVVPFNKKGDCVADGCTPAEDLTPLNHSPLVDCSSSQWP